MAEETFKESDSKIMSPTTLLPYLIEMFSS